METPTAGGGRARHICRFCNRAMAIWPRLDRRALRRCACDPRRIATVVSRRTSLSREAILAVLVGPSVSETELQYWFG